MSGHSHHVTVGGGFVRRWRVMRQITTTNFKGGRLGYTVKYVEVARFVRCRNAVAFADHLNSREG